MKNLHDGSYFPKDSQPSINLDTASYVIHPFVQLVNLCLESGGGAGFARIEEWFVPPILDEEVQGMCIDADWSS